MYQTAITSTLIATYVGLFIAGVAVIFVFIAFINLVTPVFLPRRVRLVGAPKVSILIPARNEANNIGLLLQDIAQLSYTNYEVIVYDDQSTDDTSAIVNGYAIKDNRLRLISGGVPRQGWLGKNNACNRLAEAAQGDYLLFLDADVRVSGALIEKSLQYMLRHQLGLLSVFPRQILDNKGAWLTVPLMNWILLSLLPLIMIRVSSRSSFSAANGQFMFFDSATYRRLQPHMALKNSKVEDIEICRYYKKNGIKVATLLGDADISCRMYSNLEEGIAGFSKNIFAIFGNSPLLAFLFATITTLAPIIIALTLGVWASAIYVFLILLKRIFIARAGRQNIWKSLLLIPSQLLIFWRILIAAYIHRKNKTLTWKGREIG